nr:MAG TPA: hypothetical protein [Caudoviricetes sp.]
MEYFLHLEHNISYQHILYLVLKYCLSNQV